MPGAARTHCSHAIGSRVSPRDASGAHPVMEVWGSGPRFALTGGGSYRGRMAQLGADDVEVDRLATTFDSTAARLRTSEESITSSVQSVTWLGPDADSFRTKWKSGMKAQLSTVSERLTGLAKELRAQAEAQRGASDGADVPVTPSVFERLIDSAQEWLEQRIEEARRIQELDDWADDVGRQQIRDMADEPPAAQHEWWKGLTDEQRAALLRNDPGALFSLDGLPGSVRADAREAYLDSVRGDIQLQLLGGQARGRAQHRCGCTSASRARRPIVQLADGTYRVDLELDGEIGANLGSEGAKGQVSLGGGVAQSYTSTPRPRPRRSSTGCTRSSRRTSTPPSSPAPAA